MKTIKIVIALTVSTFVICYSCIAQNSKGNYLKDSNIKGKVKAVTNTMFEVVDSSGKSHKEHYYYKEKDLFNKKGNITEEDHYGKDGSIIYHMTFKYDKEENKIELNYYYDDSLTIYKYANQYDDKGNKIAETDYKPNGSLSKIYMYKYDDKGNQVGMGYTQCRQQPV